MSGRQRVEVRVPDLPVPLSHYTDAVRFGDILFVSGLTPLDENARLIGEDDVVEQARQIHVNLEKVLTHEGASFADVLKVTVFSHTHRRPDKDQRCASRVLRISPTGQHAGRGECAGSPGDVGGDRGRSRYSDKVVVSISLIDSVNVSAQQSSRSAWHVRTPPLRAMSAGLRPPMPWLLDRKGVLLPRQRSASSTSDATADPLDHENAEVRGVRRPRLELGTRWLRVT
jgi:enamine deaminase RidA (YjgF/YER057c/UK114 family)